MVASSAGTWAGGTGPWSIRSRGRAKKSLLALEDGATLPLKVLDGNCCTVAKGPLTFPTGSRMSTFWTLMRDLLDDGKVQTLTECVKAWPLSRIASELAPGGSVRKAVQG